MLRPSRPMMRPFMSSDGSSTSDTGRLRGVACRHPLQRFGDEVARPALRVGMRLLLELAHHPRQLVANELLRALEQLLLRLAGRQVRDLLERAQLLVLGRLQLLLELAYVRLAVGEPLLSPLQLAQLAVDLLLLREHALLDLQDLRALLRQLELELAAHLHRLLPRFDLGLAPDRLGGAPRVLTRRLPVRLARRKLAGEQQRG